MKMIQVSPIKLILPNDSEEVKKFLTFSDRSVEFLINKHRKNFNWKRRNPESWIAHNEKLKEQRKTTIIFYDEEGRPWTYSGLKFDLQERFKWELEYQYDSYVEPKLIPWHQKPHEMRYYQKEAVECLIQARHGAIELPTGSGKSLILLNICKHFASKTIIVSPSTNVTKQLYDSFVKYFGPKYVGLYTGTKKQTNKLFTICTVQTLMNIKFDNPDFQELSKSKVYIFDESHTASPEEFQKASLGVCASIPMRFFVSATQMRGDGSEMVLKGITGPIVYSKSFRQLSFDKYLAEPRFKLFHVQSTNGVGTDDPKKETRSQLYLNPNVVQLTGQIVNKMVNLQNKQVLILIEEFKQFNLLKNYINVPFEFVHGPIPNNEKEVIEQEYWKSDTVGAIRRFNEGQTRVLIGTSAISTGIDLFPVNCLIYLQGGTSEIKIKQAIGRGTRPTKPDFIVVDFNIKGSSIMERHFEKRLKYYQELSDNIEQYGI